MDAQSATPWMTASWRDDIPTPQLDNQWWGRTQTFGAPRDLFNLPLPIDSSDSYYGPDDSLSYALPSETAMATDSPSMFDYVGDDFMMASPPNTPSISMAYPSPLASPASDSGVSVDIMKRKTKSARTSSSKSRSSGSGSKTKSSRKQSVPDDTSSPKMQRARTCHNVVEKNYRNRLNGQFKLMLATLNETRADGGESDGEMEGFGKDYDRSPSKSAVLQRARERLVSLQRENTSLKLEVEKLRGLSHIEFSYARTALI